MTEHPGGRNRKNRPRRSAAAVEAPARPAERSESRAGDHLVFGLLPVTEVLRSRPKAVETVFVAEGARENRIDEVLKLAQAARTKVEYVSRESLTRMLGNDLNHQGVAAKASPVGFVDIDEILGAASGNALLVVLDGIEDPRNLGAVLRTAECSGADGVVIPERRAAGLTGTVSKSAAGATEFVKISQVTNLNRLIETLKREKIWVVGASGDAEMTYQEWDWTQPTAVVFGSEGSGLHRLVKENCDVLVKIPMYGKIDSLNVSVAAGVILFEARRQRDLRRE